MRKSLYFSLAVVIIIFSVTTLSAQLDIQGSLQNWYEQKSPQVSTENSTKIANKISSFEHHVPTGLDQTSEGIEIDIADFSDTSMTISQEQISSQQKQHQQKLEETKNELLLELEEDGKVYSEEKKEKIEADLENSVVDLLHDILGQ